MEVEPAHHFPSLLEWMVLQRLRFEIWRRRPIRAGQFAKVHSANVIFKDRHEEELKRNSRLGLPPIIVVIRANRVFVPNVLVVCKGESICSSNCCIRFGEYSRFGTTINIPCECHQMIRRYEMSLKAITIVYDEILLARQEWEGVKDLQMQRWIPLSDHYSATRTMDEVRTQSFGASLRS